MSRFKKRKYLIIDAYNVMNSISEFRGIMIDDFENARDKLIQKMIEFSHYSKENIVLVFDAYLVKSSIEKIENRDGIKIIFTKYTQTADSYIEHLVVKLSDDIRNEIRVVTRDQAQQQLVMGKGAIRVLPRELYYEYINMGTRINKKYHQTDVKDTLENRLSEKSIKALQKLDD